MIYMQDEAPNGWSVYNEFGRLYSHLEEDTASAIVTHLNDLRKLDEMCRWSNGQVNKTIDILNMERAENVKLREALARVKPLADAAKEYVKAQTEDLPQHYYTRGKLLEAAENYGQLDNNL